LLNSWLDRLLVLLAITTFVLTLFALQYMREARLPPVESEAPQATPAAPPARDPGFSFAQAGSNALQAGDTTVAVRWFERAVQASPRNPEWHRLLADAYLLSGDSLRASEAGLRAFQLSQQQTPGTKDD
jgi:Flp pilus assembly protein TadD